MDANVVESTTESVATDDGRAKELAGRGETNVVESGKVRVSGVIVAKL